MYKKVAVGLIIAGAFSEGAEGEAAPSEIKPVEISGAPTYEVANTFTLKTEKGWYGLGYVDAAPGHNAGLDVGDYSTKTLAYKGEPILVWF